MKYKLTKLINANDTLRIFPENPMDFFWLGKIWGKHGGKIMFVEDTGSPKEISYYEIGTEELFKQLIAP